MAESTGGAEDHALPYAAMAVAIACIAVFIAGPSKSDPGAASSQVREAVDLWNSQAGLTLPDGLEGFVSQADLRRHPDGPKADAASRNEAQRELESRAKDALIAVRASPHNAWALIPARGALQVGWLTAPLAFASLYSLVIGLIFLVPGARLEMEVGWRAWLGLWLTSGWVGAAVIMSTGTERPYFGGACAAAAIVGAAMERYGTTQVFRLPGYAWGLLWFVYELAQLLVTGRFSRVEFLVHTLAFGVGWAFSFALEWRATGGRIPGFRLAQGGAGVAASVAAAIVFAALTTRPTQATAAPVKLITFPPAATVLVDQHPVGTSPLELDDLVQGRVYRIDVALEDHFATPSYRYIEGSKSGASVQIRLHPRIEFVVESVPAGASVRLDGRILGQAPLRLPPMRPGQTARLEVEATDHLSQSLEVTAEESQTLRFELEPALFVEVLAEPSPANVTIDGEFVASTPADRVRVPSRRRFLLGVERAGYRTVRKRLDGRRIEDGRTFLFELKPIPVAKLPLTPEERAEVRRLEGERRALEGRLARTLRVQKKAETRLGRSGESKSDVYQRARLDSVLEASADRIAELEIEIGEVLDELNGIRESATARMR